MDIGTLGGILIALVALVIAYALEGGSVLSLFTPSAILLIFGGTIGATVIGYRTADLRQVPRLVMLAFINHEQSPDELVDRMVHMAERARREGLLALQDDLDTLENPLLVRGIQLIVDGTDPDMVKAMMETQVALSERRQMNAAGVLEAAGGYAPTIGIMGTVMGLVMVLSNLSEPEKLGHAISLAFLACLWGIATANLLWLPLASKVKQNVQYQSLIGRMCIAGVTGLQTGEAPRALRERLEVYLSERFNPRLGRGGGEE